MRGCADAPRLVRLGHKPWTIPGPGTERWERPPEPQRADQCSQMHIETCRAPSSLTMDWDELDGNPSHTVREGCPLDARALLRWRGPRITQQRFFLHGSTRGGVFTGHSGRIGRWNSLRTSDPSDAPATPPAAVQGTKVRCYRRMTSVRTAGAQYCGDSAFRRDWEHRHVD
jgi:hypothetical protein